MSTYFNLSTGPTDFRRFLKSDQEGFLIPAETSAFTKLYHRVDQNLRNIFHLTEGGEIAMFTASGTGGIEALLVNVLEPGEHILVLSNGYYAERFAKMASTLGFYPSILESDWNRPFDVASLAEALRRGQYRNVKAVAVIHLETSTGLLNDIASIGQILKNSDVLYLVDAVSSIGPHLVDMKAWGIDGLVTVSHKGLLAPPGLSILALSEKYYRAIKRHTPKSFYFDLQKIIERGKRGHTAMTLPVNALLIVDRVLNSMLSQGKIEYCNMCLQLAQSVRDAFMQSGYHLYGHTGHSNGVTVLSLEGVLENFDLKAELEKQYGIFVAGGAGKLAGKVIRVGHYGTFTPEDIPNVIKPFRLVMEQLAVRQKTV